MHPEFSEELQIAGNEAGKPAAPSDVGAPTSYFRAASTSRTALPGGFRTF